MGSDSSTKFWLLPIWSPKKGGFPFFSKTSVCGWNKWKFPYFSVNFTEEGVWNPIFSSPHLGYYFPTKYFNFIVFFYFRVEQLRKDCCKQMLSVKFHRQKDVGNVWYQFNRTVKNQENFLLFYQFAPLLGEFPLKCSESIWSPKKGQFPFFSYLDRSPPNPLCF